MQSSESSVAVAAAVSASEDLLAESSRQSIRQRSREAYLEILAEWLDGWRFHGRLDEIAGSSCRHLTSEDLLHLIEEVASQETLLMLTDSLLKQVQTILDWISISANSGGQNDAIKLSSYLTGVAVPLMISVGRQQDAIDLIDLYVGESHRGFHGIFGMKQIGMTDEILADFKVTRDESKQYRYLMLAPLLMSIAAYYDQDQPGAKAIERLLNSFAGIFVAPRTLYRIGLVAMMIGSTDRALLQRCSSNAIRVGEEDFMRVMIDYATKLV